MRRAPDNQGTREFRQRAGERRVVAMCVGYKNMAYRRRANGCAQGLQMARIVGAGINNGECLGADEIGAGAGEGEGAAIIRYKTSHERAEMNDSGGRKRL